MTERGANKSDAPTPVIAPRFHDECQWRWVGEPWVRRKRNSLGMSHLAANESIVLTLIIPEVCPVAADVAAARCSRTLRISAAKDAPIGVSRTERVARIISCTPR